MNSHQPCQTISRHSFRMRGFAKSTGGPVRSTQAPSLRRNGRTFALDCSRSTVSAVRISFHPEATAELEASEDWYAEHSPDAACDFCVAVDVALANIAADPQRFVRIDARHQVCGVKKFPFQIIFRHSENRVDLRVFVLAPRRLHVHESKFETHVFVAGSSVRPVGC